MIKQNSLENLKGIVGIKHVVESEISLEKKGEACCPFHAEKTPSFRINERTNSFKCFGCGEGGDAFSFIQKIKNLEFVDAAKHIAKLYSFELEYEKDTPEKQEARSEKERMWEFNAWLHGIYRGEVVNRDEAHRYLESRNYTVDMALACEIGFAPDSFNFIKEKCIEKGWLDLAIKLGVVKEGEKGNLYDFFRNRLMFAVKDHMGRVCGFSGRTISKDKNIPKYLNSPQSTVYQKEFLLYGLDVAIKKMRETNEVYVVEGCFDVTSCHLFGTTNTVATCGTAITNHHLMTLKKYCNRVYLLMDSDAAGVKAVKRSLNELLRLGFESYVCELPKGVKDADELIQKQAKSEE